MNVYPLPLAKQAPAKHARYDLLMAIDHLLEGTQLYAQAVHDATACGNDLLAEFFADLERMSRFNVDTARKLLEQTATR